MSNESTQLREVNGIKYEFDQTVSKCSTTIPIGDITSAHLLKQFVEAENFRTRQEIEMAELTLDVLESDQNGSVAFKLDALRRNERKLKELIEGLNDVLEDPNLLEVYPFTATLSLYIPHVKKAVSGTEDVVNS